MNLTSFFILFCFSLKFATTFNESKFMDCDYLYNYTNPFTKIIPREAWRAKKPLFDKDKSIQQLPVHKIVLQHTVFPMVGPLKCDFVECSILMRRLQKIVKEDVWKHWDMIYHFVICGEHIFEGRNVRNVPASLRGFNRDSIHIAFMGDFSKLDPPLVMIDAVMKIVNYGIEKVFWKDISFLLLLKNAYFT